MEKWTELRSAYLVAKLGTISAAANELNVHRATVNRHIDSLEKEFNTKLFHRHAKGYTPTETGKDMLETTSRVEEMFAGLTGRIKGANEHLSGKLIISALPDISTYVMPAITQFKATHPEVDITFDAEDRLVRLEYGEAHIAIRAGAKPQDPDYVVQPYRDIPFSLYAHKNYLKQHGEFKANEDIAKHFFVGSEKSDKRLPYTNWFNTHIPLETISLNTPSITVILNGILAGLGIGFLPDYNARNYSELVQIMPPRTDWIAKLWIVTHVDLHRTIKVQEFIKYMKKYS